jgi:hypothetical protein
MVPLLESVAVIDREGVAPSLYVWSVIVAMLTGSVTVHVIFSVALLVPSVAMTVTMYGPPVARPEVGASMLLGHE